MSDNSRRPTKTTIENIILKTLSERDCYGYELAKAIADFFSDGYEIKQPTLYNHLKRLEAQGYIQYYWGEESLGGRRKYYTATAAGRTVLNGQNRPQKKATRREIVLPSFTAVDRTEDTVCSFDAGDAEPSAFDIEDNYTVSDCVGASISKKDMTITEQLNFQMQLDSIAKNRITDNTNDPTYVNSQDNKDTTMRRETINDNTYEADGIINPDDEGLLADSTDNDAAYNQQSLYQVKNNQQSAAEFFADFEEKIQQRAHYAPEPKYEHKDEQNYKHIMTRLLGDQIKSKSDTDKPIAPAADIVDSAEGPAALEVLAEHFAEKSIKLNFYNHETASYEPQAMLYKNKINLAVSWLTFFFFGIGAMIVWLSSMSYIHFDTLGAYLLAGLIVPIIFSVVYMFNPTKKKKPVMRFRYHFINAWITFVLAVILIFSVNVLILKIVFTDTAAVLKQIALPVLAALSMPMAVLFYNILFKKMLV